MALVFFPYASAQAQQLISTFIGQTVPPTMVAGQTYQVSVTMRNDGSETWSESTYHRLGSQNPQDNFIWGTNRAFLQGNASPGQQATFTFTVTAPNSVGTYNFQWRMVKEAVAWFGANSANAAVQVTSVTPPVAGNLIVNGGFEQTSVTNSSWASLYGAPCGWFDVGINTVGWSFSDSGSTGRGGIQRNTSCWGTTAPEGQQTAFFQNLGQGTTSLNLSTGSYTLKFKSANRTSFGGQQFMAVKLNGNSIYTFTPSPTFTQHEIPFSIASSGTNTLTFAGLSNGPDNTAFVDDVQLKVVTPPPLTVSRINVVMDNGTTVTVDNISSYSTTWVSNLVLAADRSTREDSPYDAPVSKGLFKTGDRIVVSNNYLAWLDFTIGDGAPSTHNDWARGGELAGYWRLDPATQYFKYFTTGPSGKFNWPRNMLVPGSASPANEDNFWDNYAPPTEHTIYSNNVLYSHHYAQRAAAQGGGWNLAPGKDGQINAFGSISYQTNAFMTSANNIVSSIFSEVEYRFDQEEILSYWRFKSSAAVAAANVYVYLWMAYSPDANKPPLPLPNNLPLCDQAVQGRWPTYYATRSIFVGSNRQIKSNTGPFAFQQLPANSILQAYFSSKCPSNDTYFNDDINTSEINSSSVTNGAFLTISESNTLSLASRTLTFKYLSAIGDLSGSSSSNPANFPFTRMVAAGERRDMVFGFGIADGPYAKPDKTPDDRIMLTGSKWYQGAFSLR